MLWAFWGFSGRLDFGFLGCFLGVFEGFWVCAVLMEVFGHYGFDVLLWWRSFWVLTLLVILGGSLILG